jgi:hypothetical protein
MSPDGEVEYFHWRESTGMVKSEGSRITLGLSRNQRRKVIRKSMRV